MSNVLFLLGHFGIGGVERVTVLLANALSARGHGVSICCVNIIDRTLLEGLDERVGLLELGQQWRRADKRRALREFVCAKKINVIFNQWALPVVVSLVLRLTTRGLGVRLVAVQHNAPDKNNRILKARNWLASELWRLASIVNLRLVYRLSDRYLFLTRSTADAFFRFTGIHCRTKSAVIANPINMPNSPVCDWEEKENLILYVGRLSEPEKRPSRVIEVWRMIADKLPNWRLEIVGDGPDAEMVRHLAMGLPRLTFCGFRRPDGYYRRAKMLWLTSEYEGFGVVLVEAMARGCLPIASGGIASACDIISSGEDGIVVGKSWEAHRFADTVLDLSRDDDRLRTMSAHALLKSRNYDVQTIVRQYEDLLASL